MAESRYVWLVWWSGHYGPLYQFFGEDEGAARAAVRDLASRHPGDTLLRRRWSDDPDTESLSDPESHDWEDVN